MLDWEILKASPGNFIAGYIWGGSKIQGRFRAAPEKASQIFFKEERAQLGWQSR